MGSRPSFSATSLLPHEMILAIQQYCHGGGCMLYIPKQRPNASARRKTLIRALAASGFPTAHIAQQAKCSGRYVRKVLAHDGQHGERDAHR